MFHALLLRERRPDLPDFPELDELVVFDFLLLAPLDLLVLEVVAAAVVSTCAS